MRYHVLDANAFKNKCGRINVVEEREERRTVRTTLDIDEDILLAAKEMARERRQSTGKVLSELAREGLVRPHELPTRNGFPQLPTRDPSVVVTMELVNELRDEYP